MQILPLQNKDLIIMQLKSHYYKDDLVIKCYTCIYTNRDFRFTLIERYYGSIMYTILYIEKLS